MLGWHISVYRQPDGGAAPAAVDSPTGARLAVWQTGMGGLNWLQELVKAGEAIDLGGNGYPCRFTLTAQHFVPHVADEPPEANKHWVCGPSDIILDGWQGKTVIDRAAIADCPPDEWLLVEAWDES